MASSSASLAPAPAWRVKQPSVLPGFGLTLGLTLAYLSLIVLLPLGGSRLSTGSWAPSQPQTATL